MISYPPPKFEEQKSEILQRYQLISDDKSNSSQSLASAISLSLRALHQPSLPGLSAQAPSRVMPAAMASETAIFLVLEVIIKGAPVGF